MSFTPSPPFSPDEYTTHIADPPPPPPPRPATWSAVIGAGCAGLAVERAAWASAPGLGWTVAALVAVTAIAVSCRPIGRSTAGLLALAAASSIALAVRGTPWLVVPNLVMVIGSLTLAAGFARGGRIHDTPFVGLVTRSAAWCVDTLAAPWWLTRPLHDLTGERGDRADRRTDRVAVAIGLVVAAPIVVVLVALLGSADESFARLIDPLAWGTPIGHIAVFGLGAVAIAGLVRQGSRPHHEEPPLTLNVRAEVGNVVMRATATVFGVFAVTRLASISDLEDRIVNTRGLTWSGEAREGFFQLLAVAAITLGVLLVVRVSCRRGSQRQLRIQARLAVVDVVLILGIVVVAISRLLSYQERFGWTMLRLWCTVFAVWLAIVFVLVAVAFLGVGRTRSWLAAAQLASAALVLLILNIVGPAGWVAERNLARADGRGASSLDVEYLVGSLGDDALPALESGFADLSPADRQVVGDQACRRARTSGVWSFHLARARGDVAAAAICDAFRPTRQ